MRRVHFRSSKKPDMVLSFLRDNGFSNTQISKIIGKLPLLLIRSVEKTLKPKFDFFKSQGISGSDLATVLCQRPQVLDASLERTIVPCFELMRKIVQTDAKFLVMLKRSLDILTQDPQKNLVPNMALLQAQGVTAYNVAKSLVAEPKSFLKPTSRFREIVEEVNKMKFHPSQFMFLVAIHSMTKSSLEAKFDVYRRWGLSQDEIQSIFRMNPRCMVISEKNIMSTMTYFVKEMGYTPSLIAKQPTVIMSSLKRRIIPRCSVIQILKAKGLMENVRSLDSLLKLPDEVFLKKYVMKFEREVPGLLSTYQRKRDE